MDGSGDDGLRDLFPLSDPIVPAGGFDFFSQGDSSDDRAPRTGLQALDLNSQSEDFPNLSVYSGILAGSGGEVTGGRGSRTLGLRAPRNRGRGRGRAVGAAGGRVRGRGRSMSAGVAGGRGHHGSMAAGAASGGGRGGSMAAGAASGAGRGGSMAAGAASGAGRGGSMAAGAASGAGRGGSMAAGAASGAGRGGSMAAGEETINLDDEEVAAEEGFVQGSQDGDSSNESDGSARSSSSSDGFIEEIVKNRRKRNRQLMMMASIFGMYNDNYMHKQPRRIATVSGLEWVHQTLANATSCYNMFRMSATLFHRLHDLLVESYGLRSTNKMESLEALGMFLWMVGAPQSVRQADDRLVRSTETISRTFDKVLTCLVNLATENIRPSDPEFKTVHPRLQNRRFAPFFNNCIGAIDGTHVPVVVPTSKVIQHMGRHGYTTQNVLAICDFDMKFTFVVTGWPGSVHDMRVFNSAISKYADKFPHPPPGKFYLVDSGYPNRPGYLAPYKGTKYHLPEFQNGPMPQGDIRKKDDVLRAFRGVDCVFHLASYGMSGKEMVQAGRADEININGTCNVLDGCHEHGVRRLVYVSTYNVVFGGKPIVNGNEALPYFPIKDHVDAYGRSKSIAEQLVLKSNGRQAK